MDFSQELRLTDSNADIKQMVATLSGGYPGSLAAMVELLATAAKINPHEGELAGFGLLLAMDMAHIYDAKIHGLHNDLCQRNITHTHACIRAAQMGIVSSQQIDQAIMMRGAGFDMQGMLDQVKKELPFLNLDVQTVNASYTTAPANTL